LIDEGINRVPPITEHDNKAFMRLMKEAGYTAEFL
jgi:hypothetical protein